jgi:hypothetical protein
MTQIKATHVLLDASKLSPKAYRKLVERGGVPIIDESMAPPPPPPPPWSEVFNAWKASLVNRIGKKTAANYRSCTKKFLGDLSQPMSIPTEAMLNRFINASDITAGARIGRRSGFNSFFTFLTNAG